MGNENQNRTNSHRPLSIVYYISFNRGLQGMNVLYKLYCYAHILQSDQLTEKRKPVIGRNDHANKVK